MIEPYELEKWIWTDADYEQMGWHDCQVHAISFIPKNFEIAFDIDYIFKWVNPLPGETYFKFWITPATLVFENVYELKMELDEPDFELDIVERNEPRKPRNSDYIKKDKEWLWTLEAHRGSLSFRSIGYKQYIRKQPILSEIHVLETDLRGGISFERPS
jgi:hypothetical protein